MKLLCNILSKCSAKQLLLVILSCLKSADGTHTQINMFYNSSGNEGGKHWSVWEVNKKHKTINTFKISITPHLVKAPCR